MKKIAILILFLLISFKISAEPPKFNYDEIPFGATEKEVLKLFEGAKIIETEFDDLTIGFFDGLLDVFRGGFYTWRNVGVSFNKEIIRMYNIIYDKWENISLIRLHFVREFNSNGPYTLFLVRKIFNEPEGIHYKNLFYGMEKSITKKIHKSPAFIHEVKYQNLYLEGQHQYGEGIYGIWTLDDQLMIFLLIGNFIVPEKPEILYLSLNGWMKYQQSFEDFEMDLKNKEQDQAKKLADDF